MSQYDDLVKGAKTVWEDILKKGFEGKDVNGFNKAINGIGNNFLGGAEYVGRVFQGDGFGASLGKTFGRAAKDEAGNLIRNSENGWDYGKIAGSYIGIAAAGRIASGGGLYKDANGDTNIIGVPFI